MRLIDADELYKLPCVHGAEGAWICLKDIHIAPTVDAELVRHGEWIPKITDFGTMVFRCSACRKFSDIHWAYCPQCGTKMDGERKEMGRLIDIDEAYKVLTDYYHHRTEIQHKALKEAIDEWSYEGCPPTVDAVEVVRCKDCKHRDPEDHKCDSGALERAGCIFPVQDGYFCAWGERREDETN